MQLEGTIGFIGAGNMAEAMTGAVITAGGADRSRVLACDIDVNKLQTLKSKYGIGTCEDPSFLFEIGRAHV
jgi:pyrroline-5-carboxylate reductase